MKNTPFFCTFREVFFVTVAVLTSSLCTDKTLIFTGYCGTGAPLSALLSGLAAIILVYFFVKRFYAYRCLNIIEQTEKSFGVWGKYLISIAFLVYLFVSSAHQLDQFTSFAKTLSFPTSPVWFVALLFSTAAFLGGLCGIRGLLKIAGIVIPLFIAVLALLFFSVLRNCDFSNLLPVYGNGASSIARGGISGLMLYSDVILLFLILPATHSRKSTRRGILSGAVTAVIINFLLILAFTAKIPYPLSISEEFPLYTLSKEVYFGRFFQRIDAILLLTSSLCNMLTLALYAALILQIFGQIAEDIPPSVVLGSWALTVFLFVSFINPLYPALPGSLLAATGIGATVLAVITALFVRKESRIPDES